ncbi:MAG: YkgJ family cysteine cluster protein [Methanolinea sp.]|nr:YkgJ family cysteine cluster protein [Methanolinea sp.]
MAAFTCTRCGKCCISLGRHIRLERSHSPASHSCRVQITGELLPVQVHPEFRRLFLSKDPSSFEPSWCPFLRRFEDGTFVCTIYSSRPGICRTFRCCTMRIIHKGGSEAGRVKGRRDLQTEDPDLREIWNRDILPLGGLPDREFKEKAIQTLDQHGYRLEIME